MTNATLPPHNDPLDLRDVVETIPALVVCALPDGSVAFVNRAWQEYTGYPLQRLSGSGWQGTIHPEDLTKFLDEWSVALSAGKPFETEARVQGADGQYRWFLVTKAVAVLRNRDSKPSLHTLIAFEDIHERKQAQAKLQQSEASYRVLVETASDAVISVDESGIIQFANASTTRIFGYDASELIGKSLALLMPELMRMAHENGLRRYLSNAGREVNWQGMELIGLKKNGQEFPIEVSLGEVTSDGKHAFTAFIRDISEKKRAEEALRRSERELRQILDLTPLHITEFGPDGSRLYNNQAGLDYHGLTLEEWQRADLQTLCHPHDAERLTREQPHRFLSGSAFEHEMRLKRRDGQYRWFFFRFRPMVDEHGRPTRWYAAATDIEDRKQAEQRLENENVALREEIDKASMFEEIVGISPTLHAVLSRVSKVAPTDSTVLITGETGTGKELIARAVHKRSQRCSRAFVSVNCAAIPRDLIASELFGHEKGAFTGATQRRLGRFELAEGGTIFLDEIGDLPAETQIALLRVLQEHEFGRVGGTGSIRTNVRVIAATNRDLEAAIAAGTFRSDLFYRLNVFPIEVPSLRERKEDIPVLVEYFIDRYASKAGKSIRGLNKKSLELLQSYPWPGNIRELQNVIERSVIVCDTENFSVDESWLSRQPLASQPKTQLELARKPAAKEKEIIEAALRESGGRVYGPSGAASKLGIPRSTLESKIRSLKINKSRFKGIDSSKNS
jgi:PAS domain S-box-containing protein